MSNEDNVKIMQKIVLKIIDTFQDYDVHLLMNAMLHMCLTNIRPDHFEDAMQAMRKRYEGIQKERMEFDEKQG